MCMYVCINGEKTEFDLSGVDAPLRCILLSEVPSMTIVTVSFCA